MNRTKRKPKPGKACACKESDPSGAKLILNASIVKEHDLIIESGMNRHPFT